MAKRVNKARRPRSQERGTNWLLIGGVIALAAIALFALLALNLREPESQEAQSLVDYCQENPTNCVTKGSADAPVTIVEVSDYGCSHCRDFNLETAGLIEDLYVTPGQVQWIVLPFALGSQTAPAAAAAMCANEQDRFFEFHHRLFELGAPQSLAEAGFLQAADDIGLDSDSFAACIASGRHQQDVQDNIRVASLAGINATPSFFVNGQLIEGNRPLTTFQQEINNAIGALQEEVSHSGIEEEQTTIAFVNDSSGSADVE